MGGRGASAGIKKKGGGEKLPPFDQFRFEGLNARSISNNYYQMDRVDPSGDRIIVRVGDDHVFVTQYGHGLRLDDSHVVWLKDWQVDQNWYGTEVLLNKAYFNPKESKSRDMQFGEIPKNLTWNNWLSAAKAQQKAGTVARWRKKKTSAQREDLAFDRLRRKKDGYLYI